MLQNWLKPISLDFLLDQHPQSWQLGSSIATYTHGFELPDWHKYPLVLITAEEEGMDLVRQSLHALRVFQESFALLDLGTLRKATDSLCLPLFEELFNAGVVPVLLSADSQLNEVFLKAIQQTCIQFSFTALDDRLRRTPFYPGTESPYWDALFSEEGKSLDHAHIIGLQGHLVPAEGFSYCEANGISLHRLGQSRQNITDLEPSLRQADLITFQMSALKYGDFPSQFPASPSGFTLDEVCQIARYAGLSDNLKGFSICGFHTESSSWGMDARALAQILWYFLEGCYQKKGDLSGNFNGMLEYLVESSKDGRMLTFWKSNRSGRWWIQVEKSPSHSGAAKEYSLIPVSYQDYLEACDGDLSERVLKALLA